MQFPVSSIIKFPFTTWKTLQPNIYIYWKTGIFRPQIFPFSKVSRGFWTGNRVIFKIRDFSHVWWSSSMFWKDSTWTCQRLVEHRSSGGKWKKGEISERNKRNESLIVLHTYTGRLIKLSSPIHPQLPFK